MKYLLIFITFFSFFSLGNPKCDVNLKRTEKINHISAPSFSDVSFKKILRDLQITYTLSIPPMYQKAIEKLPDSKLKSILSKKPDISQKVKRIHNLTHDKLYQKLTRDLEKLPNLEPKKAHEILSIAAKHPNVIKNQIDYIFFRDFLYYTDRYKDHTKKIEFFFKNYDSYRSGNLEKSQKVIFSQVEDINKKSHQFYEKRKQLHQDESRALKEAKEYKNLKFLCHAKTLKKPTKVRERTFKGFAYTSAAFFLTLGYIAEDNFEKTDGELKYLFELSQTLVATYLFNKQVLKVSGTFVQKFSTLLLYSLGFNSIDSATYYIGFDQKISKDDLQILTQRIAKEIQRNANKYDELKTLVQLIDKYDLEHPDIQNQLEKLSHLEFQSQDEFNDYILEQNAKNLIYLEKHDQNNMIKTGSETLDRFLYNNGYAIVSTVKSLYIGLQLSKLLCEGWRVGPYFVGGKGNLTQALTIMTGVAIADKFIFNTAYYSLRDWMIGQ